MTFGKVRQTAMKLPDVEEGTAYGFAAFRVRKKMFLCFREDLGAIGIPVSFDQRDAMIEEDPATYFTTDHHRPYPWVLARVIKLKQAALTDLLQAAWRHAEAERKKPKRRASR